MFFIDVSYLTCFIFDDEKDLHRAAILLYVQFIFVLLYFIACLFLRVSVLKHGI